MLLLLLSTCMLFAPPQASAAPRAPKSLPTIEFQLAKKSRSANLASYKDMLRSVRKLVAPGGCGGPERALLFSLYILKCERFE